MMNDHIIRGAAAKRYTVEEIRKWSEEDLDFYSAWRVCRGLVIIGEYLSAEEAENIVTLIRTPEHPWDIKGPVALWIKWGGPERDVRSLAKMGITLDAEEMIKYVKQRAEMIGESEKREVGPPAVEA